MGVMSCNRKGCNKIMCDYYSDTYGYICYDCLKELIDKGFCDIRDFMNTEKRSTGSRQAWETYVSTEFGVK